MKFKLLFFFTFLSISVYSQDHPLSVFDGLVGKTWVADGNWGDGTAFKQEISFSYDLGKSIIRTNSDGFVDLEQTKWGKRNHGMRKWNASNEQIEFWEFDVFGGLTQGTVVTEGDNIYYQYEYKNGNVTSTLTDGWEKIDDRTYKFTVGIYSQGKWTVTYLQTKFHALPQFSGSRKSLDQILDNTRSFSETYMNGDHKKLATFYTEDGKIMPGGVKIIQGRSAIADRWELPENIKVLHHVVHPEKIEIRDDIAYDYGYYHGATQRGTDEKSEFHGKYVIIWKKVDGEWLIDVDIWNSN